MYVFGLWLWEETGVSAENPRNNNHNCEWSILISLFLCNSTKSLSIFQLGKKKMTLSTVWILLSNLLTVITLTVGKNTVEHVFIDVPPHLMEGYPEVRISFWRPEENPPFSLCSSTGYRAVLDLIMISCSRGQQHATLENRSCHLFLRQCQDGGWDSSYMCADDRKEAKNRDYRSECASYQACFYFYSNSEPGIRHRLGDGLVQLQNLLPSCICQCDQATGLQIDNAVHCSEGF